MRRGVLILYPPTIGSALEWDYPFGEGLLEMSGGPSFFGKLLFAFFYIRCILVSGLRCLNVGFMPSKGNLLRTQAGQNLKVPPR